MASLYRSEGEERRKSEAPALLASACCDPQRRKPAIVFPAGRLRQVRPKHGGELFSTERIRQGITSGLVHELQCGCRVGHHRIALQRPSGFGEVEFSGQVARNR